MSGTSSQGCQDSWKLVRARRRSFVETEPCRMTSPNPPVLETAEPLQGVEAQQGGLCPGAGLSPAEQRLVQRGHGVAQRPVGLLLRPIGIGRGRVSPPALPGWLGGPDSGTVRLLALEPVQQQRGLAPQVIASPQPLPQPLEPRVMLPGRRNQAPQLSAGAVRSVPRAPDEHRTCSGTSVRSGASEALASVTASSCSRGTAPRRG